MDYNYKSQSTPGTTCDEKSIKVLGQWFYFWSQTKILFVESKPVEMSNDYDSPNLS